MNEIEKVLKEKNIKLHMIIAQSLNGIIGNGNKLPWHVSEELKLFKETTMGHDLIMGRNTFISIPKKLEGRKVHILASKLILHNKLQLCDTVSSDIVKALFACADDSIVYICGGKSVYNQFIDYCEKIIVSVINQVIEGDILYNVFEEIDPDAWKVESQDDYNGFSRFTLLKVKKKYKAKIYITLKESVLDPQGTVVAESLRNNLNFKTISNARIGKYIELYIEESKESFVENIVLEACDKLLVNHVVESYIYEIEEN